MSKFWITGTLVLWCLLLTSTIAIVDAASVETNQYYETESIADDKYNSNVDDAKVLKQTNIETVQKTIAGQERHDITDLKDVNLNIGTENVFDDYSSDVRNLEKHHANDFLANANEEYTDVSENLDLKTDGILASTFKDKDQASVSQSKINSSLDREDGTATEGLSKNVLNIETVMKIDLEANRSRNDMKLPYEIEPMDSENTEGIMSKMHAFYEMLKMKLHDILQNSIQPRKIESIHTMLEIGYMTDDGSSEQIPPLEDSHDKIVISSRTSSNSKNINSDKLVNTDTGFLDTNRQNAANSNDILVSGKVHSNYINKQSDLFEEHSVVLDNDERKKIDIIRDPFEISSYYNLELISDHTRRQRILRYRQNNLRDKRSSWPNKSGGNNKIQGKVETLFDQRIKNKDGDITETSNSADLNVLESKIDINENIKISNSDKYITQTESVTGSKILSDQEISKIQEKPEELNLDNDDSGKTYSNDHDSQKSKKKLPNDLVPNTKRGVLLEQRQNLDGNKEETSSNEHNHPQESPPKINHDRASDQKLSSSTEDKFLASDLQKSKRDTSPLSTNDQIQNDEDFSAKFSTGNTFRDRLSSNLYPPYGTSIHGNSYETMEQSRRPSPSFPRLYNIDGAAGGSVTSLTRIVRIKQGAVQGTVVEANTQHALPGVERYLGLPYAAAPVGNLRFMPPGTAPPWSGLRSASELPPVCPQMSPPLAAGGAASGGGQHTMPGGINIGNTQQQQHAQHITSGNNSPSPGRYAHLKRLMPYLRNQSEDCLYLNIYAPLQDSSAAAGGVGGTSSGGATRRYPVLVFVHGESYEWGSGNPYDGSVLAAYANVLVVTVNYRLGILGFMRPSISERSVANFALLDQIAALQWIKDNISAFGGDRNSVTLLGHNTGSACVNLLMVSPVANGLFHRAILMSGSALSDWAMASNPLQSTMQVAQSLNCPLGERDDDMVACLRRKRLSEIMAIRVSAPKYSTPFGPVVDGQVVPNDPDLVMRKYNNLFSRYECLYGVTEQESYHLLSGAALLHGMAEADKDSALRFYFQSRFEYRPDLALASTVREYNVQTPLSTQYSYYSSGNPIAPHHIPSSTGVYHQPHHQQRLHGNRHPATAGGSSSVLRSMASEHRDALLDVLSDARVAAPVVLTGQYHSKVNAQSYMYVFAHNSQYGPYADLEKSVHGEELAYLFGAPVEHRGGPFISEYVPQESLLSEVVMTYFTNFAKSGNPNSPRKDSYLHMSPLDWREFDVEWPEYNTKNQSYLFLSLPPNIGHKYRTKYMTFWNHDLPEILKNKTSYAAAPPPIYDPERGGHLGKAFPISRVISPGRDHKNSPFGAINNGGIISSGGSPTRYNNGVGGMSSNHRTGVSSNDYGTFRMYPHSTDYDQNGPRATTVDPFMAIKVLTGRAPGLMDGPPLGEDKMAENDFEDEDDDMYKDASVSVSAIIAIGLTVLLINTLAIALFFYRRNKRNRSNGPTRGAVPSTRSYASSIQPPRVAALDFLDESSGGGCNTKAQRTQQRTTSPIGILRGFGTRNQSNLHRHTATGFASQHVAVCANEDSSSRGGGARKFLSGLLKRSNNNNQHHHQSSTSGSSGGVGGAGLTNNRTTSSSQAGSMNSRLSMSIGNNKQVKIKPERHSRVRDWIQQEIVHRCSPKTARKDNASSPEIQLKQTHLPKPNAKRGALTGSLKAPVDYMTALTPSPSSVDKTTSTTNNQQPPAAANLITADTATNSPNTSTTASNLNKQASQPQQPPQKPTKVSVAVDATPATRGSVVLQQQPIEVLKKKMGADVMVVGDADRAGETMENDEREDIEIEIASLEPILVKIEHFRSTNSADNNSAIPLDQSPQPLVLQTFSDINVTSRDEVDYCRPRQQATAAETLQTIKRRKYPKVLPNYPDQQDEALNKRYTLPALHDTKSLQQYSNRTPPPPPPRISSTLGRNQNLSASNNGNNSSGHHSTSSTITEPSKSAETLLAVYQNSIDQMTLNSSLQIGPLVPRSGTSNISTCNSSTPDVAADGGPMRRCNSSEEDDSRNIYESLKKSSNHLSTAGGKYISSTTGVRRIEQPRYIIGPGYSRTQQSASGTPKGARVDASKTNVLLVSPKNSSRNAHNSSSNNNAAPVSRIPTLGQRGDGKSPLQQQSTDSSNSSSSNSSTDTVKRLA